MIEAEHSRLVVIAEKFGITSPIDCSPQGFLGVSLMQMVLELELEPLARCAVLLSFVQHMPDVARKRHEPDQMFAKSRLRSSVLLCAKTRPAAVSLIVPSLSSANSSICKASAIGNKSLISRTSGRAMSARAAWPSYWGAAKVSVNPPMRLGETGGKIWTKPPWIRPCWPIDSVMREVRIE